MIIAIEGITKTGKSTLCEMVYQELKNSLSVTNLNSLLDKDEFLLSLKSLTHPIKFQFEALEELLLYSIRLHRKAALIENIISEEPNSIIIVDRYIHSIVAFFTGVRNIELHRVEKLIFEVFTLVVPDIVFFIDADLQTIKNRIGERPVSRKNIGIDSFFEAYRTSFLSSLDKYCCQKEIIDGNNSLETIAKTITKHIITAHNKSIANSGAGR